jgi:hypothetical protein
MRRIHAVPAIWLLVTGCDDPDDRSHDPSPSADDDDGDDGGPAIDADADELLGPRDPQASAFNVLNSDFAAPWLVPPGDAATTLAVCLPTPGAVDASASKYWTTFANTPSTSISSWIVDAPSYPASGSPAAPSNLVAVGGPHDGLVQVLVDPATALPAPQCTRTDVNRVTGWVWVVAGEVYLLLGNGGAGSRTPSYSTTTGKWEPLVACGRPDMWNNEIVVYGTDDAVFYVDDVQVDYSTDCLECPHDARTEGVALAPECGACEQSVCAADPYCCTTSWDPICVGEAMGCPGECP